MKSLTITQLQSVSGGSFTIGDTTVTVNSNGISPAAYNYLDKIYQQVLTGAITMTLGDAMIQGQGYQFDDMTYFLNLYSGNYTIS